ncbi:MAG: hypothetical protein ACYCPW_03325 [Nitrososphaerales archaeon]
MDETTFKILDALASGLGSSVSINELTKKIDERHGAAYYANIYEKAQNLVKQGIINISRIGKSSIASLNFKNYLTVDLLADMESRKKQEFLFDKPELQMLFSELDTYCIDLSWIKSMSLISPERNEKLNRAELLILFKGSEPKSEIQSEIFALNKLLGSLQRIHNIKIDYLTLTNDSFLGMLKSDEINPLKEMLSDQITFLFPQAFWIEIRTMLDKGMHFAFSAEATNPAKIHEEDMIYNLARFGYKEIGRDTRHGEKICIEYITTSILMKNDARQTNAIPIILAKNKPDYILLVFLAQKYDLSDKLLGLLKVLNQIRPVTDLRLAIGILEAMNAKEIKVDRKNIQQKMRLYNAI